MNTTQTAPVPLPVTPAPSPAPRRRAPRVAAALVVLIGLCGGALYLLSAGKEKTDDAQVEGHIQPVSARISGQVSAVHVKDNQLVNVGDLLVELDKNDLDARLATARADLAAAQASRDAAAAQLALTEKTITANLRQAHGGVTQASSGVISSRAAVAQARADRDVARAHQELAEKDFIRGQTLRAQGAVAQADFDMRRANVDSARATLAQAEARLAAAQAGIAAGQGGVELAQGRLGVAQTGPEQVASTRAAVALAEAHVQQNQAALRLAELNLSYAVLRAPARGIVSRRTVEVGQQVSPDRALLAIVPLDDLWVVANFKEDQLAGMRPGQRAEVKVDAFGGPPLAAVVDSLAGGTGSRFSLLPPDNASGNFVKVVQRIPVLLRFSRPPLARSSSGDECHRHRPRRRRRKRPWTVSWFAVPRPASPLP